MAKQGRGQRRSKQPDEAAGDGKSSFAWEFGHDEPISPPRPSSGAGAEGQGIGEKVGVSRSARREVKGSGVRRAAAAGDQGHFARTSADAVHQQLDLALDRWWAGGELPPLPLLRDGLLALEAGHPLSESQRTLLLRTALAHDRGIQTALRHQVDAERVALVLAEAIVEWEGPIETASVEQLVAADDKLRSLLIGELERSRVLLTGEARRRAQDALDQLRQDAPRAPVPDAGFVSAAAPLPPARRKPLRQLLLLLLLVTLVGFVMWQRRQEKPEGMVAMPSATYALLEAEGSGAIGVPLASFWIDQFEVTNRAYRACVDAGACAWPVSPHSATRLDYFTNPAFDAHPVVNVTYAMAESFCAWQGKRLPSAEEWQAAASVSPTNGQAFRYPWGETFDTARANSAASGLGDTVAVGSFRPGGDSPSGAADMAGNVAEWSAARGGSALVKGGSFASMPEELFVGSGEVSALTDAAAQRGFRCARTRLLPSP